MMARIRSIKPQFFTHGDLFDAEQSSRLPLRLAFAGLWAWADREGRFEWKPRELKLGILPYDDVHFPEVLDALADAGFIFSYAVDGKRYGVIPTFKIHQRFNPKEAESIIPAPPADILDRIEKQTRLAPDTIEIESTSDEETASAAGKGREGKGGEGKGSKERGVALSRNGANGAEPLPSVVGPATVAAITHRLSAVLAEVNAGQRRRITAEQRRRLMAGLVFAYWAARTDHPKTLLDRQRESRLMSRLEENGGNVDELLYCIDGAVKDDWIMGRDQKSTKKYDGIETIFRDRAQVERLAGTMKGYRADTPHPTRLKWEAALTGEVGDEKRISDEGNVGGGVP